jgi:hypothetical protein
MRGDAEREFYRPAGATIQATTKIRRYNDSGHHDMVMWGGQVKKEWWNLTKWRADRPESSTVEGRKRKAGEKRGRKSRVGV